MPHNQSLHCAMAGRPHLCEEAQFVHCDNLSIEDLPCERPAHHTEAASIISKSLSHPSRRPNLGESPPPSKSTLLPEDDRLELHGEGDQTRTCSRQPWQWWP